MSLELSVISASQGTFIVNDTTEKTILHDAIVVLEDTVFNSIKIGGVDVKSSYIAATGTAVKAGAIIRPTEVVGVKEVMKGLSFIDEDMYNRIKKVLDPQMRQVEATAKGYVPSNAEVLSGWSKPVSSQIDYRPFPKYNADSVRGGIGYKEGQNRRFKNGFQVENYVYNINAAGRIYESYLTTTHQSHQVGYMSYQKTNQF